MIYTASFSNGIWKTILSYRHHRNTIMQDDCMGISGTDWAPRTPSAYLPQVRQMEQRHRSTMRIPASYISQHPSRRGCVRYLHGYMDPSQQQGGLEVHPIRMYEVDGSVVAGPTREFRLLGMWKVTIGIYHPMRMGDIRQYCDIERIVG